LDLLPPAAGNCSLVQQLKAELSVVSPDHGRSVSLSFVNDLLDEFTRASQSVVAPSASLPAPLASPAAPFDAVVQPVLSVAANALAEASARCIVGATAWITGLLQKPELNNAMAIILEPISDGRVAVRIPGSPFLGRPEARIKVKLANLRFTLFATGE
jgi:hypothetical protein